MDKILEEVNLQIDRIRTAYQEEQHAEQEMKEAGRDNESLMQQVRVQTLAQALAAPNSVRTVVLERMTNGRKQNHS